MPKPLRRMLALYSVNIVATILLVCLLILLNRDFSPGNIENATIDLGESELYTLQERADAAKLVLENFRELSYCTLETVTYSEIFTLSSIQSNREYYSAEYPEHQTIVFLCEFVPSEKASREGFTPNTTYRWDLTLVRNTPSSSWRVVGRGEC